MFCSTFKCSKIYKTLLSWKLLFWKPFIPISFGYPSWCPNKKFIGFRLAVWFLQSTLCRLIKRVYQALTSTSTILKFSALVKKKSEQDKKMEIQASSFPKRKILENNPIRLKWTKIRLTELSQWFSSVQTL